MDLSGVLAAVNSGGQKVGDSQAKLGNDFDQFLQLLTTQLQNQDPLSPMDTAEFTNQLVQFSGVEQQIRSNDFLQKMLTLQSLNLTNVGLGYIGLDVQMPGSNFQFNGTDPAILAYDMPAGATVSKLSIIDASGEVVYEEDTSLSPGPHNLAWDGKDFAGQPLPAGSYQIRVGAQDADKNPLSVATYVTGTVAGVENAADGDVLLMIGNQLVPVTEVRQATLPGLFKAGTNVAG